MTAEQLIQYLRQQGYLLNLDSTPMGPGVIYRYASRFWRLEDSRHVDYEYTNTIDEAVRLAAITISERDDLEIPLPSASVADGSHADGATAGEKPSEFIVWAYGILWGIGIILGVQILIGVLR